ncbi:MAG: transcriptional repressor LexA [Verrucomicrobia bacterium]|nr:transcriptional repressor LexA [Verrucomicrobiota bacterium]
MKGITESQKKVLRYISQFLKENGYAPTAQEIASEFRWGSKTAALDHLRALEKKNILCRKNGKARSIQILSTDWMSEDADGAVLRDSDQDGGHGGRFHAAPLNESHWSSKWVEIPVFGSIPAGKPQDCQQEKQGCLSVELDYLGLKMTSRTFALEVRGDSMIERHILDGDVVILEHGKSPRHGDVVAALIDGESTLKTYVESKGRRYLKAENPKYPDLLPAEELVTQGVMLALIRKNP